VNGLAFTSVTAASIDANGDINLTFFAAHNAVLFQIVEFQVFHLQVNGKYRIKGYQHYSINLKGNIVRTVENQLPQVDLQSLLHLDMTSFIVMR
jgi:hypothetical protein